MRCIVNKLASMDWSTMDWLTFFVLCVYIIIAAVMMWQNRLMWRQIKESGRQNAWHELFATFDTINEFSAKYDTQLKEAQIPQPYPEPKSGEQALDLLFHHLNLIYRYWIYKESLTPDEREGFERWMNEMFFCWLANNKNLSEDYQTVRERKDLYSEKFLKWLKDRQQSYTHFKDAKAHSTK